MAEIVYGDQALSEPVQQLARLFQDNRYEGTLYIGYPILSNVEGTVRVDALYVSRASGVVVFDANHLHVAESDERGIEEVRQAQWPAPGSEDTELGVLMELEVGHGETEVYPRVQA
jgi:hypothetical protein